MAVQTTFDFSLAKRDVHIQQLTRPSLSYWQDAFLRLRKNKRALGSLCIVILLLLFTLLGPVIWQVDPAEQNLEVISQAPSIGQKALVIEDEREWEGITIEGFPAEPTEDVAILAAPEKLELIGEPTIYFVRLRWQPVVGASGYTVYRSEKRPESLNHLGMPLGDVEGAHRVSFEDRLKIAAKTYYYSVLAKKGSTESDNFSTLEVKVSPALSIERARLLDPNIELGQWVKSSDHPFGTDYLGRDMLARLIEGARVSLFIGLVAPLLFVLFGTLYGGIAGYIGGSLDNALMRVADFVVALPFLLFMIIFKVAFGIGPGESGIMPMIIALVVLSWPPTARLVRGEILKLREEAFVQAAKLLGASPLYLLIRHMIPNMIGILLVTITFAVPSAIFTEAFLSFIGLGVAPPTASWGSMCNEGIKTMLISPHELLFPAIFISVTVLAFNLLGDGLRDAMDARMRSRE